MEATYLHFKQFNDIKKQYPDAILLFRCDDHYEAYNEDATQVAKILDIPLTEGSGEFKQTTSFPYPQLEIYLPKLVRAGYRIAICDQLDPPKHSSPLRPTKPETWIQATLF